MFIYPTIDPIFISIPLPLNILGGHIDIMWYGVMYLLGFTVFYFLAIYRVNNSYYKGFLTRKQIEDTLFYGAIGLIVGGRIGYVLFYHFDIFLENPAWLLNIRQGGMSFHGAFIGGSLTAYLYAKKNKINIWQLLDFAAPLGCIGLGLGRIGNFINGELWGRATDLPWGMIFPHVDQIPRHPSQLYQAFLEGVILFSVLWIFSKKPRPTKSVFGLLIAFYAILRFLVEFVRQPDANLGFIFSDWLTMGQLLSLPMIIIGCLFIYYAYKQNIYPSDFIQNKPNKKIKQKKSKK